jgi:hypothetical protein
MLVCNISQSPPRRLVSAELAEINIAIDETDSQTLFATIIDEPASADEIIDAFVGVIILEETSASDDIDAIVSNIQIAESATANDTQDSTVVPPATIAESATASDTQDASVVAAVTTWNPADKGTTNTILSNANLTYGAGASNTTNDGCRSTVGRTTGKLYFELTTAGTSSTVMLGVGTSSAIFNVILSGSGGSFAVYTTNGHIWNNATDTTISIGAPTAGTVYCYAIDLVNMRGWIRKDGGNWNNSGTANPATNTGGQDISWLSGAVYVLVASNVNANPIVTANFGATSFAQAIPSGFAAFG